MKNCVAPNPQQTRCMGKLTSGVSTRVSFRWFVLTPHYIAYYKGLNSPKPSYVLSMVNISNIEVDVMGGEAAGAASMGGSATYRSMNTARSLGAPEESQGGYSFALLTPDTRLEILCADLQERTDWLVAIKAGIDRMVKDATERSITAGISLRRSKRGAAAAKAVSNGDPAPGGGGDKQASSAFSKRAGPAREPSRANSSRV